MLQTTDEVSSASFRQDRNWASLEVVNVDARKVSITQDKPVRLGRKYLTQFKHRGWSSIIPIHNVIADGFAD